MRFVVAALAAFLVLMLDLDGIPARVTINPDLSHSSPSDRVRIAAALFESARASEKPDADARQDAPPVAPAAESREEPKPSATDMFCDALRAAAEASEIPVAFFARLIWQESRFQSKEVSHAGAKGVAQFMPETAKEIGLDDPFDPFKALPASAKLLSKLRDDFGNLGLAAAAYNAGSGRIQKWISKESELPRETRDYVRIITGTKAEDWIEDADMLAIRVDLPSDAPCEGIGGLSKSRDVAFVSALPAPAITTMIGKARAAQAMVRIAADRGRKRLVLLIRKSTPTATRLGKGRHVMVARAHTKGVKGRAIRVASRERSSS
jgi:hypothetical protein